MDELASSRPPRTLDEFCRHWRFSKSTFYNLRDAGKAPKLLRVSRRVLVTPESKDAWRRVREAEAKDAE